MKKYGSRENVWNGEAEKTRGGLTRDMLMLSKTGRIVSKKKSLAAAESYKKYGFKKREAATKEQKPEPAEEVKPVEPKKKRRRRKNSK